MKIICNKNILLSNINMVQKAVASNSTIKELEGILLEANNNLKLTGNDLEIGIECNMDATVEEPGSIVLNAKIFGDIVKRLPEDTIYMEVNENNNTKIKCGNSEFNIIGLSSQDFTELPEVRKEGSFSISQEKLKSMIHQTIFAVSNNQNNAVLTGCYLETDNSFLNMVAVDGYRLALRKEHIKDGDKDKDNDNKDLDLIIPGKTLNELSKILNGDDEQDISMYVTDKHVLFEFDNCRMVSRLLEGDFLKYKQIIPLEHKLKVKVSVKDLIDSIERVSLIIVSDNQKYPVKLDITIDKININCATQTGTVNDSINAETLGDDIEIGFNHKYLLDALKACECNEVYLELTNNLSPCVIRPIKGGKFTYLVLPVRLKND